jgi:hypothetical protein
MSTQYAATVDATLEKINSIAKNLLYTVDSWCNIYERYKNPEQSYNLIEDVLKDLISTVSELRKKYPEIDEYMCVVADQMSTMINPDYKPVAEVAVKEFKKDPWGNINSAATELFAELEKNKQSGGGKHFTNIAKTAATKFVFKKFVEKLFDGNF